MHVTSASTSASTSEYLLAHNVQDGRIRVSFAGAESRSGPGPMLELVFDEADAEILGSLRLERVYLNEGMIPAQIVRRDTEAPTAYWLSQNYPNPFNPETAIRYTLPEEADVRLMIYNTMGQTVRTLVDASRPAGYHQAAWNGRDDEGHLVSGGVYFYRMTAGEFSETRRMILLR